jgi:hypothetical protein
MILKCLAEICYVSANESPHLLTWSRYLDSAAKKLYLWPNASGTASNVVGGSVTPPPLSGAVLATLIALNGSEVDPVRDVSFHGIGFGRTRPTYLDIHERPISGE